MWSYNWSLPLDLHDILGETFFSKQRIKS
jgi:hypothetical protein